MYRRAQGRDRIRQFVAALACSWLFPMVASAQQAQLSGVVADTQSAAITTAEARLVEPSTGIVLNTRSNERGAYVFASVRPGTYRLEVVADGFARFTREDLALHVDQRAVLNVILNVGDRSEAVTVAGVRPLLGMADGSVGTVIDRRLTESLPLRGRSFSSLVALVPGVVTTTLGDEFRVNGQRGASNTLLVDGASAPGEIGQGFDTAGGQRFSTTVTGVINGGLSVDAIQEIHVQTSSFAAEFGRTPGAQISLVTRSGTNRMTGALFEQFRNENMSANDWFANRNHVPKPESKEHQFGAVLGGAIVKSRLFFFASYEGLRLNQPAFVSGNVPSLEARQQPSVVRDALNMYPLPTGPTRADGTAAYDAYTPLRDRSDTWGIRLDHARRNVQLFGRYSRVPSTQENASPFTEAGAVDKGAQNLTLGTTATLGSGTLLDIRANYNSTESDTLSSIPLYDFFPDFVPATARGDFSMGGLSLIQSGEWANNRQRASNVIASLSQVRGSHQLKAGVDYRVVSAEEAAIHNLSLRFSTLAQALLGNTGTASAGYRMPTHATFQNVSLYAQDSWKIRSRLALMLGLRWDVNPPPSFRQNEGPLAVTTFEPISALKMTTGRNVPLWKTNYTGFFPRFGFSYALDAEGRTVLSGGAGLFGDLNASAAGFAARLTVGAATQINSTNVTFPLTRAVALAPDTPSLTPPYPGVVYVIDPNLDTPKTTQWNLTVQRALGSRHEVSVSYVGARGFDLLQNLRYPPGLSADFQGNVWAVLNGGRSRYRSMQARYRGRLLAGLESLVSYTLGEATETEARLQTVARSPELRPSGSDVRHVFNAAVTWTLPEVGSGPLAPLWNGWGLHFVATARSGYPFSARSSDFTAVAGQEFRPERFASLVAGVPITVEDANAPGGRRFNRAAFVDPPVGEQGNTTLNQFRGFGARQFDAGLQRTVPLAGRAKLRVRIDAFNVFNTPTFSAPVATLSNQNFGVPVSMAATGLGTLYRTGGPRTAAASFRVEF